MRRRVLGIVVILRLFTIASFAQLAPPVDITFLNSAGTGPLASGFICTTVSGGTTSQLTYQDQALTTANQNPVRLNASGRPVNGSTLVSIFLQNLNYRFTAYAAGTGNTCNGVTVGTLIKQVDGVNGALVTGSAQIANLGLGAAADVTARLLVSQASNTTTILIVNSSVNKNWGIYNITNGSATDLRFNESNASADRITLQAGGNVGIGTTNPNDMLHVNGTGRFTRLGLGADADPTALLLASNNQNGATYITVSNTTNGASSNAQVRFTNASDNAYIYRTSVANSPSNAFVLQTDTGPIDFFPAGSLIGTISAGGFSYGGATTANVQFYVTGSGFTGSSNTFGIYHDTTLNGVVGGDLGALKLAATLVEAASGTHSIEAGVDVAISITNGAAAATDAAGVNIRTFASDGNTTNASGLRVAAPTAATNNYAINITSGVLHFGSSLSVAGLPSCAAANQGSSTYVIDANATTFNSVVAGGGANIIPVFCDGTNWRIH